MLSTSQTETREYTQLLVIWQSHHTYLCCVGVSKQWPCRVDIETSYGKAIQGKAIYPRVLLGFHDNCVFVETNYDKTSQLPGV